MAPLPKRRHSSARQSKRSRALKTVKVSMGLCSQCGKLKEPHRVCRNCGYYDGKAVIVKKEKVKRKEK